jgi:acyl-CoA synthetase (AMP-forming)/AMP-acid ligase II
MSTQEFNLWRVSVFPDDHSFPDELMISEEGRSFSFASGNAYIERTINLLLAKGLSAGDRVAVLGENSADHIMLLFAAGQLGIVLVPLNYRLAVDELEYIIRRVGIHY